MFRKILLEKEVREYPETQNILERFKHIPTQEIDRVDSFFGRVYKPYLQKRDSLQLFLGKKRGKLLKKTPDAYGMGKDPHYYFVHAYNCVFECEYCYLQGYFSSPDIVLFLNHAEICKAIKEQTKIDLEAGNDQVWFHAGEFSDSLALASWTGELSAYWNCFKDLPSATLELRSKSANIKPVLEQEPLQNVIISFSMSPKDVVEEVEHGTAPVSARIKAAGKLQRAGFPIAFHFDPVIHRPNWEDQYQCLFEEMQEHISMSQVRYASLGTVRFSSDDLRQVRNNYPQSKLLGAVFEKDHDGKHQYPLDMRRHMLLELRAQAKDAGIPAELIYDCMQGF